MKEKIGFYAGSFNPFHKGHYNILLKGEAIFDRVILGFGRNPEKETSYGFIPDVIRNREVIFYDGLLTDQILLLNNTTGADITLIRGLRNSTDLQYELTQYRFLQDLMPNIKVVSIFCDKEFEHISSSSIRMLDKYGKGDQYKI